MPFAAGPCGNCPHVQDTDGVADRHSQSQVSTRPRPPVRVTTAHAAWHGRMLETILLLQAVGRPMQPWKEGTDATLADGRLGGAYHRLALATGARGV